MIKKGEKILELEISTYDTTKYIHYNVSRAEFTNDGRFLTIEWPINGMPHRRLLPREAIKDIFIKYVPSQKGVRKTSGEMEIENE